MEHWSSPGSTHLCPTTKPWPPQNRSGLHNLFGQSIPMFDCSHYEICFLHIWLEFLLPQFAVFSLFLSLCASKMSWSSLYPSPAEQLKTTGFTFSPLLELPQYSSVFCVLENPDLYTVLHMQPYKCLAGKNNDLFWCDNGIISNTAQYVGSDDVAVGANHWLMFSLSTTRTTPYSPLNLLLSILGGSMLT